MWRPDGMEGPGRGAGLLGNTRSDRIGDPAAGRGSARCSAFLLHHRDPPAGAHLPWDGGKALVTSI